jgi:hypothetical protein
MNAHAHVAMVKDNEFVAQFKTSKITWMRPIFFMANAGMDYLNF